MVSATETTARHALPAVELLVDVLATAADDLDRAGFYSSLSEAVCRLAGMRRAVIFRYDATLRRADAAGACGVDLERFAGRHVTVEVAPLAARCLSEDRVLEAAPPHDVAPAFADLLGDHPLVYGPIAAAGRWHGVIVAEPEELPLDEGRRGMLWTVGKTLALAIEARRATFEGERARELEERIDLARELHDQVVQRLFGVSLVLSSPAPLDGPARARAAGEVQAALAELRAALQRPLGRESRATTTTLAAELARLGLAVEGELPAIPPTLEPLTQSVLGEAVRNASKHAAGAGVSARVTIADGLLVLEVANALPPREGRAVRLAGMGLRLLTLEALQAGGVVEAGERGEGRWLVRLAVPVP